MTRQWKYRTIWYWIYGRYSLQAWSNMLGKWIHLMWTDTEEVQRAV